MSDFKKKICTALIAISILTVAVATLYFVGLFSEPNITGYEEGNAFRLIASGVMALVIYFVCGLIIVAGVWILIFAGFSALVSFWGFCGSLCDKANKLISKL